MAADTTLTLEQLRDSTCVVVDGPFRRAFDAAIAARDVGAEQIQRLERRIEKDRTVFHRVYSAARCAEAERDQLRAFAEAVMEAWPIGGLDGCDLHDLALKHGMIAPAQPTPEEMAEEGLTEYDDWFRKTPLLTGEEDATHG